MCGLGAILRTDGEPIPDEWLDLIDARIAHRGPDGEGRFRDRARVATPKGTRTITVALVHRRMSRGADDVRVATVWHRGDLFDLNGLISGEGITLLSVFGISNAGIIACSGRDGTRNFAVRLTPVDVPAGDVTGDCRAGFIDLLTLLSEWGPCTYCIADLDGDGTVGPADLMIVLATWG